MISLVVRVEMYRRALMMALTARMRERMKKVGRIIAATAKQLVGRKTATRSKPGEFPKSKSGNYRRSIKWELVGRGRSVRIGPSWPQGAHAALLKYGTKRMGARAVPAEGALEISRGRLPGEFSGLLS